MPRSRNRRPRLVSRPSAPPEAVDRFHQAVACLTASTAALEDKAARIAIAVSGGPDSLALLLLAQAVYPGWLFALTVDHGLRPEAGTEAAGVARICAELGVAHRTLLVPELKGVSANVQAAARMARYAVMAAACAEAGAAVLMTGHHMDDQAETLLMRLSRGSGIGGLSGIRAERALDGILLARPLLDWRKAELVALVRGAGLQAADDPSNRSPAYDRTAARVLLSETPWLDPGRIAATAHHLAEAETALCWTADQGWRGRAAIEAGTVLLDVEGLPGEIVRRLVLRAILALNPDAAPDGPAVDRLIDGLRAGRQSTLAGIRVAHGRKWRFTVAPPRKG